MPLPMNRSRRCGACAPPGNPGNPLVPASARCRRNAVRSTARRKATLYKPASSVTAPRWSRAAQPAAKVRAGRHTGIKVPPSSLTVQGAPASIRLFRRIRRYQRARKLVHPFSDAPAMTPHELFHITNIAPLEALLLEHNWAALFTGRLYWANGHRLERLDWPAFLQFPAAMSPLDAGRLFMAPDESILTANHIPESLDGSLSGLRVSSDNPFVVTNQPLVVIVYRTRAKQTGGSNNLHLGQIVLDPCVPEKFCTIAYGLMAITAYKYSFKQITLFAAGHGAQTQGLHSDMIGYRIWPKFGFDAPLMPVDLQVAPQLSHCRSVQQVLATDACWWTNHGSGRTMVFDLEPESRSWHILINYIFHALEG